MSTKNYRDIDSASKDYVNDNVSEIVGVDENKGDLLYLEGKKCRSTYTYMKAGINPSRLIIVEKNPETYRKQLLTLKGLGISLIRDDVFDVIQSLRTPHLFLDLMTDSLNLKQTRILREWFDYIIRRGYEPNLFLTLTGRSQKNGQLYKRVMNLKRQFSEIDYRISLRTYYAYSRPKGMTMVFLHFRFYLGQPEFRPQKIVKELANNWCEVKWWGLTKEHNSIESPESDAVKLLKALEIESTPEAKVLARCFLELPDAIPNDDLVIQFNIRWDMKKRDPVDDLMELYCLAEFARIGDNRTICLTGSFLSALFKEVHRKRYQNILEKASMELAKRLGISTEHCYEFFNYSHEVWKLCRDFPLLASVALDLRIPLRHAESIRELLALPKNEKVSEFLFPRFWKMELGDYLLWVSSNQENFVSITKDAKDIKRCFK